MPLAKQEVQDMQRCIRTALTGGDEEAHKALARARTLFQEWRARGERGAVEVDLRTHHE